MTMIGEIARIKTMRVTGLTKTNSEVDNTQYDNGLDEPVILVCKLFEYYEAAKHQGNHLRQEGKSS